MNGLRGETLLPFLRGHSTLALATTGGDGAPWVAPVFYVVDDQLTFWWLSSPLSRHSANLARDPRAAGAVYPDLEDWTGIHGIQLEGVAAAIPPGAERIAVLALYQDRFRLPAILNSLIDSSTLYALRPSRILWLDNRRGFGTREELTFSSGAGPGSHEDVLPGGR